jgi:membrane protease YdiL (CAAX protease family)
LVIIFGVIYILPQCIISGYNNGVPLYAIIIMIPMMLFGGGLEEAGWRYILQPELEKRFNFTVSTLIVSIIWWIWHLPLFFIQGVNQYGTNYLGFGITVFGLSFSLASIRKNTNSVWLCVLFHCIVNALAGIYMIKYNVYGNIVTTIILIIVAYISIGIQRKKIIFK